MFMVIDYLTENLYNELKFNQFYKSTYRSKFATLHR